LAQQYSEFCVAAVPTAPQLLWNKADSTPMSHNRYVRKQMLWHSAAKNKKKLIQHTYTRWVLDKW
jgi:hypothetical protein